MDTLEDLRAGKLAGARQISLSCGLRTFPRELLDLSDTLEILDLSGNKLSDLPDDFDRLKKLRVLVCFGNTFQYLPEVLGRCPELILLGFRSNRIQAVSATSLPRKLRWLILTDNNISELPAEIGGVPAASKAHARR